jgi:hypothetical protein
MLAASQFNGSSLALAAGVVAVFRRKQAIGGWLFYFFCQVLLGLALIAVTTRWKLYLPSAWSDPRLYFLYTLSNLSRTALLAEIAVVSAVVVHTREWRWVSGLKYALLTYAFLTLVKLLVDIFEFPSSLNRDAASLSFPCVWVVYFDLSRRVRRVFLDKNWQGS